MYYSGKDNKLEQGMRFIVHKLTTYLWNILQLCDKWTRSRSANNNLVITNTSHHMNHVTNKKVRNKKKWAIRSDGDLLTVVNLLRMGRYGHIFCSTDLAKTILKERSKEVLDRKDNIHEWTGINLETSQKAADNTNKWRRVVP